MLSPYAHWLRVKSDDLLNPKHGNRISLTLRGAAKSFLSNVSFLQAQLDVKLLHQLTKNGRVVLRTSLGYVASDDFSELPLSLKFLTGGSQSVRGYKYQSLGPGRYLFTASAEYQHRIFDQWNGALFYDMGNAFNDLSNIKLKQSIGIGVIRETPIGPLEIAIAKPLDKPGQPIRLVFNLGPAL